MRIHRQYWILLTALSIIAFFIWHWHTYPQFSFINLSVGREQARKIAKDFIREHEGIDPENYISATLFSGRSKPDRYLQKSLGFAEELKFFQQYDYELFFWKTRLFREQEEDQFFVTVSAATGEVTAFAHHIPETAEEKNFGREEAKRKSLEFLKTRFNFSPVGHKLVTNLAHILDHRTDYTFEWEDNNIFIPWDDDPLNHGGAKLQNSIKISGDKVLAFQKNKLQIPEEFERHIHRQQNVGKNFSFFIRIIFFTLLAAATFSVLTRRNTILLHTLKRPVIVITTALFVTEIMAYVNGFEHILYNYPTTSSMMSYLWRVFSNEFLDCFIVIIAFPLTLLAGEVLHHEMYPEKRYTSLFHHLQSTFLSRNVASLILLGYLVGIIMLGIQSLLFFLGETYFDVWTEYRWMSNFSSSYFPFISAFVISVTASLTEEIKYRLFGISLGKKLLKTTFLAVIISSLFWGYSHTNYPIYPMWFRGLEVSCLGILLALTYVRFDLIPVITAHYFFDAFWGTSNFLLGKSSWAMFATSLGILAVPLIIAVIAFWTNRKEKEGPLTWKLSAKQQFNVLILKDYLKNHPVPPQQSSQEYLNTIVNNGWDIAVVEKAFRDLKLIE